MVRFVDRQAVFLTFADSHSSVIAAITAGYMLERVQYRVSFATDSFDNANFRNWRVARVGWGLWFGPTTDGAQSWSADRGSSNWIHWQASPWIPDYETVVTAGVATPANSYRAGIFEYLIDIPVYRTASGAQHQLRHYDVDSELSAFPTYSFCSETVLHLWAP